MTINIRVIGWSQCRPDTGYWVNLSLGLYNSLNYQITTGDKFIHSAMPKQIFYPNLT